MGIADFKVIEAGHYEANCPECGGWLWRVGPDSGFFGNTNLEKASQYVASDGDSISMKQPPAPLSDWTEFDAKLLKGECPHCDASYWFVLAAFPEVPVSNLAPTDHPCFLCDESYLDILGRVTATWSNEAEQWTVMRQRARWSGREFDLDVHIVGPFEGGESLVGSNGVSSCVGGPEAKAIWKTAAEVVTMIAPSAKELLDA